jgi:hypothetical protein
MSSKPTLSIPKKSDLVGDAGKISHPGMMGDGTEEQNLNEQGDPTIRIKSGEVEEAFGKDKARKL